MKIPETSANVGAYYGNEENGQWQPNGVIIDNGVGGGVVGSGDAGMHRPVYPVHIPRAHVPAGYVMAGAYYGAPYATVPQPDDFADYMWMENEEEFDKQVLQQLEEEALMEQCIEAMLEDEKRERRANRENNQDIPTTSNGVPAVSLEECVSRSTLNPLAAEFVPTRVRQPPAPSRSDEKLETSPTLEAEAPSPNEEPCRTETESTGKGDSKPDAVDEERTEETVTPPKDPPEVSAADIHPNAKQYKKDKEVKKQDPKKVVKADPKKKPVAVVKSETKVQPKKKELKPVMSDVTVEERTGDVGTVPLVAELSKPQTPTTEEPSTPGLKPINYAAAARASKPKPKSTTPPSEKPTPQPVKEKHQEPVKEKPKLEKAEKKVLPKEKSVPKEKANMQRKNSVK